jgi:hypothetical protein
MRRNYKTEAEKWEEMFFEAERRASLSEEMVVARDGTIDRQAEEIRSLKEAYSKLLDKMIAVQERIAGVREDETN